MGSGSGFRPARIRVWGLKFRALDLVGLRPGWEAFGVLAMDAVLGLRGCRGLGWLTAWPTLRVSGLRALEV